jgi:diaminobutyrate acetyltransferase
MGNQTDSNPRRGDGPAWLALREPGPDDGPAVFDLVARCPPLDPNSRYCNLLQCSHFAATSIIAPADVGGHAALGFVSGYRIPARPDTLFIWQVAVDAAARGWDWDRACWRACWRVRRSRTSVFSKPP